MVRIIPTTVTADTAATLKAKFLFFSILFSLFILKSKSVRELYRIINTLLPEEDNSPGNNSGPGNN